MNEISLFKLWHQNLETEDQKKLPGQLVILNDLKYEEKYSKLWLYLQEYRIHFIDLGCNSDYYGFFSASVNSKFHSNMGELIEQKINSKDYYEVDLCPIVLSQKNWKNQAFNFHIGMDKYIYHYLKLANISDEILNKEIIYCNSFIANKEIYLKAKDVFSKNVLKLFEDFNYKLDFHQGAHDEIRKGGCLCERLWGITLRHFSQSFSSGLSFVMWNNMVQ